MARTFLITGSASGIGAALKQRLEDKGHKVIGVDLRNAEIEADLSKPEGRRAMVDAASALAPEGLHGVLAGAGLSHPTPTTLSINYFGAVATLEGLRPLLAKTERPRAVAICSTAAILPINESVMAACHAGDEALALERIAENPQLAYSTSKRSLALWLRKAAVSPEWGGKGILLNGIGPGVVETPMTAQILKDEEMLKAIARSNPMAVQGYAKPWEIAELIDYLLNFEGHYMLGQIIYNDGGSDAFLRPDVF